MYVFLHTHTIGATQPQISMGGTESSVTGSIHYTYVEDYLVYANRSMHIIPDASISTCVNVCMYINVYMYMFFEKSPLHPFAHAQWSILARLE